MGARGTAAWVSCAAVVAALGLPVAPAGGATIMVTTIADSGPGSLRQAITDANATVEGDTIAFDIPAAVCSAGGVCTIGLSGTLPQITQPLVIDGTTQPASGSAPANVCATVDAPSYLRVEVVQQSRVGGDNVFQISAPATVRGLAMGAAAVANGVVLGSAPATLQCNHFGISGDGALPLGVGLSTGVCLSCIGLTDGALIGTDGDGLGDVGERNVFGGSGLGIYVNWGSGNVIAGNYFGLAADGVTASGLSGGVFVRQQSGGNRIGSDRDGISDFLERNLFANISGYGVFVTSDAGAGDGNQVVGNWFGLDAQEQPAPNGDAFRLSSTAGAHVVADNRFAGNTTAIAVVSDSAAWLAAGSTGNCIDGNGTGVLHAGSAVGLALAGNWWGAGDGPAGEGGGSGDPVFWTSTGSVAYAPWLADPPSSCRAGLFADGFEPGDTRAWTTSVP